MPLFLRNAFRDASTFLILPVQLTTGRCPISTPSVSSFILPLQTALLLFLRTDAIFMCRYYFGGFYGDYESPINDNPKEIKKRIKAHIEREYGYSNSKTWLSMTDG